MPSVLAQIASVSRKAATKASRLTTRRLSRATARTGLVRLGSAYGGWWVPSDLLGPESVCYLAGVGEDATFDLALIDRFGCEVYAFDPTPRACAYVADLDVAQFHFMPVGLWRERSVRRFYEPRDPSHVSHSITNLQRTDGFFEADCRSVSDLMSELGHGHIDLLKLDIEGAEGPVLDSMLSDLVFPSVVCVEFDAAEAPWTTLARIRRLRSAGYILVKVEERNYVFVSRSA
jgi:FkbM family methyltransferase